MSRMVQVVLVGVVGTVAGGFAVSGSAVGPSSVEAQPPQRSMQYLICEHFDGSRRWCSDSSATMVIARGSEVLGGTLILRLRNGDTVRWVLPDSVDALFFTPEGIRILAEHYDRTNRPLADSVRGTVQTVQRRAAPPR